MKLHSNAKTCPKSRLLICRRVMEEGWSLTEAARAAGVSDRTASKWLARYRSEGEDGLLDRRSAPESIPHKTPEDRIQAIAALRRIRMSAIEIAGLLDMALSTVSVVLARIGLGKLSSLEPKEPQNRYQRRHAGELIHIDIKKLARIEKPGLRVTGVRGQASAGAGWEYVHVAIDDATRIAHAQVKPNQKASSAVAFLRAALVFYKRYGITVKAVMTDNGGAYLSVLHSIACRTLGLKHIRTRPYRPQTNGKAERLIRTMLGGWAYGAIYRNSEERTNALDGWLYFYNHERPHSSIGREPPVVRLGKIRNNVVGSYK